MKTQDAAELAQTLFEEIGDAAFITDPLTMHLVDVNPRAQRMTGLPRRELLQCPLKYLFRSKRDDELNNLRRALHTTQTFHSQEGYSLRHGPEEAWTPVNLTVTRLHSRRGQLGLVLARDITERIQAEEKLRLANATLERRVAERTAELAQINAVLRAEVVEHERVAGALRQSEERFRSAFEHTDVAMVLTDADNRFVRANAAFARLFGYSPPDMVGMTLADVTHPDDLADSYARRQALLAGEGHFFQQEKRYLHRDGHTFWGLTNVSLVRDPTGRPVLYVGQVQDVTERKRAEAEVRRSGDLLRAVADGTTDAVFVKDREGRYLLFNEAAARFVGRPAPEVIGKDDTALFDADSARRVMDRDRHIVTSGVTETAEETLTAAGVTRTYHATKAPYRDEQGNIVGLIGVSRDITARKRTEQRLATQHAVVSILAEATSLREAAPRLLRAVCETMGWEAGDLWISDRQANVLRCVDLWSGEGDIATEFCDLSRRVTFTPGMGLPGRVWAADGPVWIADIAQDPNFLRAPAATKAGLRAGFGFPIRFGAEILGVAEFFGRESRQPDAELLRLFGTLGTQIGQFIEQKRTQEAMTVFRALIDKVNDSIEVIDPETGRILDVNEMACESHGYTRAEYLSLKVPDLDPTMSGPTVWAQQVEHLRQSGSAIHEGQHRRKDGSFFPIEVHVNYIRDHREYLVAVVRDITERKRSEEALRTSEARFRAFMDNSPAISWTTDEDGRMPYLSQTYLNAIGLPAEAVGKTLHEIFPPDLADLYLKSVREVVRTGRTLEVIEPAVRADGSPGQFLVYKFPLPGSDRPRLTGGVAVDVTEQRRTEDALRTAEQRLQHVMASNPALIVTLAVEGEDIRGISWVSNNLREMLGYSPAEASDAGWWLGNIHPEDRDRVIAQTRAELFTQGRTAHEYRFRHHDGTYRWTRGEIRLLRDEEGVPIEAVGSWSDITERRELEEQFRQAQKMEAVGRLAGGVAHDFNNLLTIINGYGELLLSGLPTGDPNLELIREMVKAGERAAGLTRQLLTFSRKAIVEPRLLDLTLVVNEVERMLRRIVGEDIQLAVAADPEAGAVRADPGQVEQVILNLVVNARDAMPRGGRLTIEVRSADLDATYVRDHPDARPGPHVFLAVTDTGCGMDSATVSRVFEPFFSTKGEYGTGLGLATVHGIVRQAGGHVAVYSELGRGTTFKVYLPCVENQRPVPASRPALSAMPKGDETILLVEDEDGVRALTRHILQSCGYAVFEARDGVEAAWVAQDHQTRIDLLVTDVVMPRLSGREVAEQLLAMCPGLKVLFLSGYTDDAVVRHGILENEVAFLQKPFTPASLAAKVREVLNRSQDGSR